jgi:hypothetical protein
MPMVVCDIALTIDMCSSMLKATPPTRTQQSFADSRTREWMRVLTSK